MGLKEEAAVDAQLEDFLGKKIAIPATARSRASDSQKYLRQVLRNKANLDPSFPELLSREDSDFLGGSFARHTKIWPLDDIDLFLPMDGGTLVYERDRTRLPFTIMSDVGRTRLYQDRYLTNGYVDSVKVLNGFRDGLRDTYPSSQSRRDGQCVSFQTTVAATSESTGIGFDVVPCFRMIPFDGSEAFYLVPDGTGGWMRSNPRKDTELCAELHDYHNGTYRKAVRLVKYWNKTQLNDEFLSYYIELAVSKKFLALKQQIQRYGYLLHAFATAIAELKTAYTSGDLMPLVSGAPAVKAPALTDSQKAFLDADVRSANSALRAAYQDSRTDEAFQNLNAIFGKEFFG